MLNDAHHQFLGIILKLASLAASLCFALSAFSANAAPTLQTSDFIPDGSRTGFNGFENIPNDGISFTGGSGPYTEGGINVEQINGDTGNGIWVTYNFGGQHQGNTSWYPDGGDLGYTQITLLGGGDFASVGMLLGTGFSSNSFYFYDLLDGGVSVLSGFLPGAFSQYLGFSGGGFDTVRIADCGGECDPNTTTFTDGHLNALAVDSIEVIGVTTGGTVPEPGSMILVVTGGLIGLALRRRQRA